MPDDDLARLRTRCRNQRRELRRLNSKLAEYAAVMRGRYRPLNSEEVAELRNDVKKLRARAQKAEGREKELRIALENLRHRIKAILGRHDTARDYCDGADHLAVVERVICRLENACKSADGDVKQVMRDREHTTAVLKETCEKLRAAEATIERMRPVVEAACNSPRHILRRVVDEYRKGGDG